MVGKAEAAARDASGQQHDGILAIGIGLHQRLQPPVQDSCFPELFVDLGYMPRETLLAIA